MLHVPILRSGRPYRSLALNRLSHVSSGEMVAEVSLANRGLIARDLLGAGSARRSLATVSTGDLLDRCRRAAKSFMEDDLPVDDGTSQSPEDYVRQLSSTTGMPWTLCRSNMEKIRFVLAELTRVLGGLTRGLETQVLDDGYGFEDGRMVSYLPQADNLGAVLPANSPGVHSLWIPAVALKTPLVLKPGGREPWSPLRILRALQAAGIPDEALGFYPTDHSGAAEIMLRCGRSMLFGDESTLAAWKDDPRVQLHGPGWSKVIVGEDQIGAWESHLDVMVGSAATNGGRSCINASGVWVPSHGDEVAEAVARRLAAIEPLPLDHPEAQLAAFSEPRVAHAISAMIDRQLRIPGAVDVSARVRGEERVVEVGGCTFLRPTVIRCQDPDHPLAAAEFLFPFLSVVEADTETTLARMGPTLVATVLSEDDRLRAKLLACPHVDRLNLGPIPTCTVSWDQPHEGNLFEHLYRRRALQDVRLPAAAGG